MGVCSSKELSHELFMKFGEFVNSLSRVGAKLVNNFIIEITNLKDLEKLHQHEKLIRENKNLNIKGRPTKKDRRNLKKFTT